LSTCFYRVLRRIVSVTHELDVPWDPDMSLVFGWEDLTLSDACAFLDLPSIAVDPLQMPFSPPPP